MLKINHVIVASDLSDLARTAYPHAAAMARALNADITLLHVDDLEEFELIGVTAADVFARQVIELRGEKLDADVAYLSRWAKTRAEVRKGRPRTQIADYCRAHPDALLVMARRGFRDTASFSQSTPAAASTSAGVPVLITPLPEHIALADDPATYHLAAFPTDFSEDNRLGLQVAAPLLAALDAKLTVLNVLRRPFFAHLELDDVGFEQLKAATSERLTALLTALDIEGAETLTLLGDDPTSRMLEYFKQRPQDLVVIPTHGQHVCRDFIGQTTQTLLAAATDVAVLVLPREALRRA
jgi:nucleotide-binding universal stress UspA family protein